MFENERTYEHYNGSYAQDVEGWSDQTSTTYSTEILKPIGNID